MIALIDADELAYRIALQYQRTWYYLLRDGIYKGKFRYKEEAVEFIGNDQGLEITKGIELLPLKGYEKHIDDRLSSILHHTSSTNLKLFLSGDNNFRETLSTLQKYKGNRDGVERPIHLNTIKDALRDKGAESVDYLEADDLMSIYGCNNNNAIICSSDKDLRTVPSNNFNISTRKISKISKEVAMRNFYYQLLIGDSTDNIPSPYMLGEMAANKFLDKLSTDNEEDYYQAVASFYMSYLKKGKTKWYSGQDIHEVLFEIGNLIWMRRTLDPNERWRKDGI